MRVSYLVLVEEDASLHQLSNERSPRPEGDARLLPQIRLQRQTIPDDREMNKYRIQDYSTTVHHSLMVTNNRLIERE